MVDWYFSSQLNKYNNKLRNVKDNSPVHRILASSTCLPYYRHKCHETDEIEYLDHGRQARAFEGPVDVPGGISHQYGERGNGNCRDHSIDHEAFGAHVIVGRL